MTATLQEHLRESVLKTALIHLLKNKGKSPERTARNILELLSSFKFLSGAAPCSYEELISMLQSLPPDDCIREILKKIA